MSTAAAMSALAPQSSDAAVAHYSLVLHPDEIRSDDSGRGTTPDRPSLPALAVRRRAPNHGNGRAPDGRERYRGFRPSRQSRQSHSVPGCSHRLEDQIRWRTMPV
jgi:hypothetical protein